MMKTYEMNDLGLLHYFLGVEVNQQEEDIFICQNKYTENILRKYRMEGCKTISIPSMPNEKLKKEDGSKIVAA